MKLGEITVFYAALVAAQAEIPFHLRSCVNNSFL